MRPIETERDKECYGLGYNDGRIDAQRAATEELGPRLLELRRDRAKMREYASELLLAHMRAMSEFHTYCGWVVGLEFMLWGTAFHGRGIIEVSKALGYTTPITDLNTAQSARLRILSGDCDGWWVNDGGQETLITRAEMAARWTARGL